ncbi:MAG: bifunctional pyr operon transcriptional regulator/uracil phosphoribosyltransferase PyrR [Ruminococcaceae bacterium]|nr:bifunctional pyr operon transcriptional regulator/uracil phosphoribosyltransferase PyrR [Oscillospiraceae bacterium]
MIFKSTLMDKDAVLRSLRRISHEILEKNKGGDNLCLVGILRRGVPMAQIIAENIKRIEGVDVNVGILDISAHRDDIDFRGISNDNKTDIPFEISGKNVVLVDDVLFTGRSVRAAMDALMSMGRPAKIQLATLIDRGHRELPVCANYIGKNFPTARTEMIKVYFDGIDEETCVKLYDVEN